MKPLILVGGGGHCKSVIEAAESMGLAIGGILDLLENVGGRILGYPVIGTDDDIPRLVSDFDFIVTLGFIKDPYLRIRLHERIEAAGGNLATVIACIPACDCPMRYGYPSSCLRQCRCIDRQGLYYQYFCQYRARRFDWGLLPYLYGCDGQW